MSLACASPTMGPLRGRIVISALCLCFSTARTTLVSNLSPRILRIMLSPVSTSLRMMGVISYCRPVYSTFMERPPQKSEVRSQIEEVKPNTDDAYGSLLQSDFLLLTSLFYSSLMRARDFHIFPIFRH